MSTSKLLTILVLAVSAFAQEKGEPNKKPGMFWHFFAQAEKADTELYTVLADRYTAFANLTVKVKEGDPNKIRLYLSRAKSAQNALDLKVAGGSDYSRNLKECAGVALNSSPTTSSSCGYATEEEYDRAMKVVKTIDEKVAKRPLTEEQKKIWSDAVKALGYDDPKSIMHSFYTLPK